VLHVHGDEVEIRLTRKRIAARDHDGFWQRTPSSDWIGLPATNEKLAAELLAEAVEANRQGPASASVV
jgi:hypothetical protein